MTNVEILTNNGKLEDLRKRLGADNDSDNSYDNRINKMTAMQIAKEWCGWHLGDTAWAPEIINLYLSIERKGKSS